MALSFLVAVPCCRGTGRRRPWNDRHRLGYHLLAEAMVANATVQVMVLGMADSNMVMAECCLAGARQTSLVVVILAAALHLLTRAGIVVSLPSVQLQLSASPACAWALGRH